MGVYLYPNNTETPLKNAYIGIPFPESIVLDKSSISLTTIGQTEQLTATIEPTVSDKTITWTTSDSTVATVSTTGLVTCVTPGNCTITATTVNGLTASCSVEQGWQPGANTLAYYTFDNQTLLNSATNTVDASWYSGAGAFGEGYNGGYSANISSGGPIALSIKIPQQDFTICSCIKFNSYPPASGTFYGWFGNLGTSYSRIHCQFYLDGSTPKLQFFQYQSGGGYSASDIKPATGTLLANTWYKIVLVRNGTTVSMYIDGQLIGSGTDNYRNSTQTDTYYLGTSYDANARKLNGYLDNVIIENKARTLDEIQKY